MYEKLYKEITKLKNKYPPLGKKKERDIFIKYKETGDKKLKDVLFYSNVRLIIGEVKIFQYKHSINPDLFMDLISLCFTEAYECIDRFSINKGNASVCSFIKNSIKQCLLNYSKENIDFNGEFNTIRRFTNRFNEELIESIAANKFAHLEERFPHRGEKFTIKHNKKQHEIIFYNKPSIRVQSGNSLTDDDTELFDLIDIEDEKIDEQEYDISYFKNMFTLRDNELYDILFVAGLKRNQAIYHFSPIGKKEKENCIETGSNDFKIGDFNFRFISYHKNKTKNIKLYSENNVKFYYTKKENDIYIINVNEDKIRLSDYIRIDGFSSDFIDMKVGYPFNIQTLNSIYKKFINKMRKKTISFQICNYEKN